jgi:hypothetical protein
MKQFLKAILLSAVCLTNAFGALPDSGTITIDSSVTGDIVIFNGASVVPGEVAGGGQFGLDAKMNHNSATGQITGTADFSADFSDLVLPGVPSSAFDMDGTMKFSAKVVRAGTLTRLVGAKATVAMSANMELGGSDSLKLVSSLQVTFKKYEVDASQAPARLEAVASVSNLKMKLSGRVMGRGFNQNIGQSQLGGFEVGLLDDITVSTEFPDENFAGVVVVIRNVTTTSKGAVSGTADSILDTQEIPEGAYKISGKRDARTGFSQVSLSGRLAGAKGTSATLYVDDALEVQRGPKMKNTLKAYGYTIGF